MFDKTWFKIGLIVSIISELVLLGFTYSINKNLPEGMLALLPFPPDLISLIFVFVITFGLGALIGFLIEKFK
jgi:hypothetical protein